MTGEPVRVGVVDEYELVVAGLVSALAPYDQRVRVVALDSSAEMTPGRLDLLLYDTFDERRHVDAARLAAGWGARLVVFSWRSDPLRVSWALENGAIGYVLKSLPAEKIVVALEQAFAGTTVRPPPVVLPEHGPHLTPRETEVVHLIASGLTNEQIADLLFLSINSIKSHIRSAYRKMGVSRRSQAVTWAFVNGLAHEDLPEPRKV
ncbi:MAG: response regulator transcription factor [Nocardioides sp.]